MSNIELHEREISVKSSLAQSYLCWAVCYTSVMTQTKNNHGDVIQLRSVRKTFGDLNSGVVALDDVSIGFQKGTFTAIMGPSGSGKSMPLRLAARHPEAGAVDQVLERVGLSKQKNRRPSELSGGQQQRVAIARALITQPAVIFGDEPTGALDTRTALEILGLLREAVATGQTVVIVTHDPVAASHADRVVFLADGKIAGDLARPTAKTVADKMTRLGAWADTPVPYRAPARLRSVSTGA